MVTLELTFKEREALVYALSFYGAHADAFAQTHWPTASIETKLARTKCGEPSCTYCGDEQEENT